MASHYFSNPTTWKSRCHASVCHSRLRNWWINPQIEALTFSTSLLYHSICLSLNRHFVSEDSRFPFSRQSLTICTSASNSVLDMCRQFRSQQGLANAPLIMIYALVMSALALFDTTCTFPSRHFLQKESWKLTTVQSYYHQHCSDRLSNHVHIESPPGVCNYLSTCSRGWHEVDIHLAHQGDKGRIQALNP